MMRSSRALVGASLFSAVGALPVLFLPALLATEMVAGGGGAKRIAATGAVLMAGELVVSLVAPLLRRFRASRGGFAAVGMGLILTILWSAWASGPAYVVAWFCVGGFAALLQYLGTTRCLVEANPSAASQLRLSVSLLVSGLCLSIVALVEQLDPTSAILFLAIVCGLHMGLAFWVIGEREPPMPNPVPLVHIPWTPVAAPYVAVAVFFGVYVTFVSLLPSFSRDGDAQTVVGFMALGKIAAAPVLWLVARLEDWLRKILRYDVTMSALLAAASVAVIYVPSVAVLVILEVALNATAGIILGRYSRTLGAHDARWAFSAIQVGGAISFAFAHLIVANTVSVGLMVTVVLAAFLPVVPWGLRTMPLDALRRVSSPQE